MAVDETRAYCLSNWSRIIGGALGADVGWNPTVERWFRGSDASRQLEESAIGVLAKLRGAVDSLLQFDQLRQGRGPSDPMLLSARFLDWWLSSHRDVVEELVRHNAHPTAPTTRQFVVLRSMTPFPQKFSPLRKALKSVDWTDTRLAAVSLLVGNAPQISKVTLITGVTPAEVLQIEAHHVRRARTDLSKKLAALPQGFVP